MEAKSNSKLMSLREAISLIQDGDSIAFGGMLIYRRPIAAALELIKQQKKSLTLMGWTLGLESDLLVGMGMVDRVRTSYFGLEIFGLAPMFRKMTETNELEVIEETESTIGMGLRAGLQGVGFMPARAIIGTDLLKVRQDLVTIRCPYTGEEYPAVPVWKPKVAIIHTEMSDPAGNSVITGNRCIDSEIAQLADLTIITTEKIVETSELPPGETYILGNMVDAVVKVPNGSWPTSCYPLYGLDGKVIIDYLEHTASNQITDFIERLINKFPSEEVSSSTYEYELDNR
jgi:glutaconate CoA-transferase, subunit A